MDRCAARSLPPTPSAPRPNNPGSSDELRLIPFKCDCMNKPFLRPESGRLRAARAAFSRRAARIVQFGIAATCVALPLAAFAPAAHAERADNDKPLNIEADNMTYDDLKQVNIFTGHVVATKGTIIIRADRVDVTQDPQGYQYATGTSTGGNLSYFRQTRDGLHAYIEGK